MEGKRLIHSLRLKNFLSYGSDAEPIILQPLNVLIGPNASGKSNLIEAIDLLGHTHISGGISSAINSGGGIGEFLWRGSQDDPVAEIEAVVIFPDDIIPEENKHVSYQLSFTRAGQRLKIIDEIIESEQLSRGTVDVESGQPAKSKNIYYCYVQEGMLHEISFRNERGEREERSLDIGEHRLDDSILSQRRDPEIYPEITYLGRQFSKIKIYKDWRFRKGSPPRVPLSADLEVDFLAEGGENLALVLDNLPFSVKQLIDQHIKKIYEAAEHVDTRTQAGTIQLEINENGFNRPISPTRLSDGTLRFLCLLTILCHPTPPPLICIEEPEIGLHPDALSTIAELLVDASQRTQLIVTTHSDFLVSALTNVPESIIICDHDTDGTHLRRLDPERLKEWLAEYSLGELWLKGEIGGTRW